MLGGRSGKTPIFRVYNLQCPCYKCAKRSEGCHSSCLLYKDYLERHAKEMEVVRKNMADGL